MRGSRRYERVTLDAAIDACSLMRSMYFLEAASYAAQSSAHFGQDLSVERRGTLSSE